MKLGQLARKAKQAATPAISQAVPLVVMQPATEDGQYIESYLRLQIEFNVR